MKSTSYFPVSRIDDLDIIRIGLAKVRASSMAQNFYINLSFLVKEFLSVTR